MSQPPIKRSQVNKYRSVPGHYLYVAGDCVSFAGFNYKVIRGPDGRLWLDRNLGALEVASAYNDASAYGDLYQWGRLTDGHQIRTSGTTNTRATTDTPGNANFINYGSSPYDWRNPGNDLLWQGLTGINNPCPPGFRIPTQAEWIALVAAGGITNRATAFSSSLALPSGGYRDRSSAALTYVGTVGGYHSSTISGTDVLDFYVDATTVDTAWGPISRQTGLSVRPICD